MSSIVNIKPRVSAYKGKANNNTSSNNNKNNNKYYSNPKEDWNDASPPLQDDDDVIEMGSIHKTYKHDNNNDDDYDDNDKGSKIQRTSRQYLWKSIVGLLLFFIVAMSIQAYLEQETTLSRQQQQQQQQQDHLDIDMHKDNNNGDTTNSKNMVSPQSFLEQDTNLAQAVQTLDQQVRARKAIQGVIMETDDIGLPLTQKLQQATLQLLQHRYGSTGPFRIRIDVVYPPSIILPTPNNNHQEGRKDYLLVETAPTSLLPCSVFYFLELARTYQSGSFHRNANHVLQAHASSKATAHQKSMPFQEYHPQFPHVQYTVGYAGRPSGPGWYVSILDNSHNHGPGSQQNHNPHEADSLFGKLVNEHDDNDDSKENENDITNDHSNDDNDGDNTSDEGDSIEDSNNDNNSNDDDQKSTRSDDEYHHDYQQVVTITSCLVKLTFLLIISASKIKLNDAILSDKVPQDSIPAETITLKRFSAHFYQFFWS
jgi:hypothetical protein